MSAVIFDFDGTIADSFPIFIRVVENILGRDPFTNEEIEELRQHSVGEVLEILKIGKWRLPWLLARGMKEIDRHQGEITIFPDISDTIEELLQEGHYLHIVSSHSTNGIQVFLDRYRLSSSFESVFGNIGLFGKPKTLKMLQKKYRYPPNECAFVGDEVRDIEAANKAGIKSVAVAWGFNSPATLEQRAPSDLVFQPRALVPSLRNIFSE